MANFDSVGMAMKQASATLEDNAAHIRDRTEGVADRVCLYQPAPIPVETLSQIVDALSADART